MSEHTDAARSTRRSGEELREAIRDAVRGELFARGYAGLTFDGVAQRAHTSKPVIYRRYSTRAQMVIDALVRTTPPDLPTETTGSLRGDLMALGAALARGVEQIGADTLRRLIAEVDDEFLPELAELSWTSAQEMLGHFLEAARDRGEISQDPLPRRVVMLPLMLLRDELLFSDQVDEAAVADIVDTICLPLLCRPAS